MDVKLINLKETVRQLLPARVRSRRILGGPLRGKFLVTSWRDYPTGIWGNAEPALMDWFSRRVKPGETWLDVGANYGYTSLALCHYVGETGRVFAFEPLLSTAGHLAATKAANRLSQLTAIPLAMGDAIELTSLNVPTWKGMAQPVDGASQGSWVEPILCIALDKVWARLCGSDDTISGIKIDVEGMERSVLRGMRGVLERYKPKLVIEIHESRGVDLMSVESILRETGYLCGDCLAGYTQETDRNYEFVVTNGDSSKPATTDVGSLFERKPSLV